MLQRRFRFHSLLARLRIYYSDFSPTCTIRVMGCSRCVLEGSLLHCTERPNCWNLSPPLCLRDEAKLGHRHEVQSSKAQMAKVCPSLEHLAQAADCELTCSNDGTCRDGLQCCAATCGYNCLTSSRSDFRKFQNLKCCSIATGYRERCFQNGQRSCEATGCCWDHTRRQCFKQKKSCRAAQEEKIRNIHLQAKWYLWSGWSECDCDYNINRSFRACNGGSPGQGLCVGKSVRSRVCGTSELKNCNTLEAQWLAWTSWSKCSASCGIGERTRTRKCPKERLCDGNELESESCTAILPCPTWSSWSDYTPCSASCAVGSKTRERKCLYSKDGSDCVGSGIEVHDCDSGRICPIWHDWSEWGNCPVTCGPSVTKRIRKCSDGDLCEGNSSEEKICFESFCPRLSQWSKWSECSEDCGEGQRERSRACSAASGKE